MEIINFNKSPLTLAQFSSLNWKFLRKTRKLMFILPVLLLTLFVLVFASYFIKGDRNNGFNISSSFPLIGMIIFFGTMYYSYTKGFKNNYDNTPALSEGFTYILSDDSITMQGTGIMSVLLWPTSFKKAVKIDNWIILLASGASAYYLDTTQIIVPATVVDVENMFQRKGVKVIE